ncbi:MAG: lactate utilization protein [Erysipelotrichaceae bacterium]|nr:lactate utilization protein [Erysipelotrichaceae bacterium]
MNIDKLKNNLEELGYIVSIFDNKEDASKYLCDSIKNTSVGIGGSVTIQQLNLYDELLKSNEVYWHWEKAEIAKANSADIYLSSVNGASMDGEIINIDGTGNRVASILYGHKKVYLVFGLNKIADNYELALDRARNIAAVKNAIRLNKNTPCVKTGKCMNCKSPERICRGLTVLWEKPKGQEYEIIIVKEELGY